MYCMRVGTKGEENERMYLGMNGFMDRTQNGRLKVICPQTAFINRKVKDSL